MDTTTEDTNTICAMQEKLNADADGVYKQEMTEFFSTWYDSLKTEVDKGLAPDDFSKYNKLMEATGVAGAIVDIYWNRAHSAE